MTLQAPIPDGLIGRLSDYFYRHSKVLLALLLSPALLWLGVIYVGSLMALLAYSFFALDDFSGQITYQPTLATYEQLADRSNIDIIERTLLMATTVTLTDAIIAFPIAYFAVR